MIITKYVCVRVTIHIPSNWKRTSQQDEVDVEDTDELAEHIINEADYRFEFDEKYGHIADTEIMGMQDHAPIGL